MPDAQPVSGARPPVGTKLPVRAELIALYGPDTSGPAVELDTAPGKAIIRQQIHEVLLTDDPAAGPGRHVSHTRRMGFVEVTRGGMAHVTDRVASGKTPFGRLVGFAANALPPYLVLVIRQTAGDGALRPALGDQLSFALVGGDS